MRSSINPLQAPKTQGVLGLVGRTRAKNVNLHNGGAQNLVFGPNRAVLRQFSVCQDKNVQQTEA